MLPGIFARGIQFVIVVSMLNCGDLKSLLGQSLDDFTDQRRFTAILFPNDVDSGNIVA